jgi:hypothetical protein
MNSVSFTLDGRDLAPDPAAVIGRLHLSKDAGRAAILSVEIFDAAKPLTVKLDIDELCRAVNLLKELAP